MSITFKANIENDRLLFGQINQFLMDLQKNKPSLKQAEKSLKIIDTYFNYLAITRNSWEEATSAYGLEPKDWEAIEYLEYHLKFRGIICNALLKSRIRIDMSKKSVTVLRASDFKNQ